MRRAGRRGRWPGAGAGHPRGGRRPRRPAVSQTPRQALDELVGIGRTCSRSHGLVAGPRTRQPDVVGDRAVEEVRPLRHPRHRRPPRGTSVGLERAAIDADGARVGIDEAQEDAAERGLARSAGAHQGHRLAGPQLEGGAVERWCLATRIREPQALERDAGWFGHGGIGGSFGRFGLIGRDRLGRPRLIEDLEGARDDRPARGAHMEARGEGAERQEELGHDEQDRQRAWELDGPLEQAQADLDRHQGDGDGRTPLQHEAGLEGRSQHVHGGVAVATADVPQVLHLLTAASEHLERGDTAQDVEEEGAERAHLHEAPLADHACAAADDHQQQQQQRAREEQHQHRRGVEHEHQQQHQHRHDHGQPAGRQELGHVLLDGVEPAHEHAADLARAFVAGPGGPQAQHLPGEVGAEGAHEHLGRAPCGQLPGDAQGRTHEQEQQAEGQERHDIVERLLLEEHARHRHRHRHELRHQRQRGPDARGHGHDHPTTRCGHMTKQPALRRSAGCPQADHAGPRPLTGQRPSRLVARVVDGDLAPEDVVDTRRV